METAVTEKCENGYIVRVGEKIHVLHGFDSHAALGKVIATALGIVEVKKVRKPRTKTFKEITAHDSHKTYPEDALA